MMHGDDSNLNNPAPFNHLNLSARSTVAEDVFSAVLGNEFHYMQRIRVLTNHYTKKYSMFLYKKIFMRRIQAHYKELRKKIMALLFKLLKMCQITKHVSLMN